MERTSLGLKDVIHSEQRVLSPTCRNLDVDQKRFIVSVITLRSYCTRAHALAASESTW